MRLFVDTEFNGFGGDLISMALVSEDGREFYGVLALPLGKPIDPWVRENVLPVRGVGPMPTEVFRESLGAYLAQFTNPIIVADWYTDLVHFFSCMAGPDHSQSWEYPCTAELVPSIEYVSATPHNALADARAIRDAYALRAAA